MRLRRRLAFGPMLLTAIVGFSLGPSGITARAATTYTIGVDNATPANHLLMYTDFFPRGGINVLQGDTIDFKWNTGSPDGFHTTTLIKTTDNLNPIAAYPPQVVPDVTPSGPNTDTGDPAGTIVENPAIGAPPACGTSAGTACPYDGTALVNSGAFPTASGHDFFATINAAPGTLVTFVCLIHPGMTGTLSVITLDGVPASTQATLDAAAAAQYTADTNEALAAEAAVTVPAATTNANGTKTFNAQAGTEAPHEQVLEFFPASLNITAGDSVKWTSTTHDIHTVTFPSGAASAADDFQQFVCEATPDTNPDTPAGAPPTFCTNPADFEAHFTGGPAGGTTLASPTTVATSGVIAAAPLPFPNNYTFAVSSAGTYTYQCKVHDHMTGQVLAAAVSAPALPKSGRGSVPRPGGDPDNNAPITALFVLGLAILVGIGIRSTRLTN